MNCIQFTTEKDSVAKIISFLECDGLFIEIGDDFQDYAALLKTQKKRHFIGPIFTSRNSDLNRDNAFWIIGSNSENEIVHTQAVYFFDIGKQALSHYLLKNIARFSSHCESRYNLRYNPGPGAKNMQGRICYHGEFWLHIGPSSCGTSGTLALLTRLMMAECLKRWKVDYFFAFMRALNACRGLAARGGFMHFDPYAMVWDDPEKGVEQEAWVTWSSREDMEHLLHVANLMLLNSKQRTLTKGKTAA